jgi:hypothetical protein
MIKLNSGIYCTLLIIYIKGEGPLQVWSGPRGFQEVKVPRFHDNGTGWW